MQTYTNGEAWLCAITAVVTVDAAVERADARGVRCEGEVMVRPLAEDGDQVCVEIVIDNILVACVKNAIGDEPHLGAKQTQGER